MAAKICDGTCKCKDCIYYTNDPDKNTNVCCAVPDVYGIVHATRHGTANNKTQQQKDG